MIIPDDSEEESESYSERGVRENQTAHPTEVDYGFADSDEEEEVRVVKTAEESFRIALEDIVLGMMKDADKYRIADAWAKLQAVEKLFKKNRKKINTFKEPVPEFYLLHMNRFLDTLKKTAELPTEKLKKLVKKKDAKLFSRFKTKILKGKKGSYPLQMECEKYAASHDIWGEEEGVEEEVVEEEPEEDEDSDDDGEETNFEDVVFDDDDFADSDSDVESRGSSRSPSVEPERGIYNKKDMYDRRFWMKKEYLQKLLDADNVSDSESSSEEEVEEEEEHDGGDDVPEFWTEFDRNYQDEIRQLVRGAQKKNQKDVRRTLMDLYDMDKEEALLVWNWLRAKVKKVVEVKKPISNEEVAWDDKRVRKIIDGILHAKGSMDRQERKKQMKLLKEVDTKCERPQWRILVKILLIDSLLDQYATPRHLKQGAFNDVTNAVSELIVLLTEFPRYRLHRLGLQHLELTKEEKEKKLAKAKQEIASTRIEQTLSLEEDIVNQNKKVAIVVEDDELVPGLDPKYWWQRGNLHGYCDRLNHDSIVALKKLDSKSDEYQGRLEDKVRLSELCEKCREYSENVIEHKMQTLQFRHFVVKLTYEDYDSEWDILKEEGKPYTPFFLPRETRTLDNVHEVFRMLKSFDPIAFGADADDKELVEEYNQYAKKIKEESTLFTIHHLARHHRYLLARDILKASGIAKDQAIQQADILTQILYNRTVARLAVAAFAQEDYSTAMTTLQKLYVTGKIKELLAQGVKNELRWKSNKTPEDKAQMQQEEQRMVPIHTFINQDLLESVHYISSLFFCIREVLLSGGDDSTHNQKNRSFRRQWDKRQKREFLAPPENDRECILEAGSRMMKGDWRMCLEFLSQLKCWEHFEKYSDKVKKQVFDRAQAECLRCYLISSSKHFESIKLSSLAEKFEMELPKIVQLCSQFIAAADFRASLDIPGGYLIVHENLPTQFETSANVFHRQLEAFYYSIKEVAEQSGIIRQQGHNRNERYRQNTRPEGRSAQTNWRG